MSKAPSKSIEYLQNLIRCPSVTPSEGGALNYLQSQLEKLGFEVHRVVFSDENTPDVDNLYARLGNAAPHICFAGHTDVVPVGDVEHWSKHPFEAEVVDGEMIGRGAVDMKGGIACFMAAVENYISDHGNPDGSISFLITGDEEGPSINGTDKLLKWADDRGEKFDACIVGEPSNANQIGDTIKNGRRGSLSGKLLVHGIQGHAAYPHLADNPVRGLMDLLDSLLATPFDEGTEEFQPTNLEVTSIDVGNPAANVIPASASAIFNVRFNDTWNGETMVAEIKRRFDQGAKAGRIRRDKSDSVNYSIDWIGRVSPVFLTMDKRLIDTLSAAVNTVTGHKPKLSTGGGTSDARFIKDYCAVVEFGLIGQTMHQVDERVGLNDLEVLSDIYKVFLNGYFGNKN